MKCIVKKLGILCLTIIILCAFVSCGSKVNTANDSVYVKNPYNLFDTTEAFGVGTISKETSFDSVGFWADDLCVGGNEDVLNESVTDSLSEAALLFSINDNAIVYANDIHERLYPASTTKILTAYIALKYGDLSAKTTVSADALKLDPDSSLCYLSEGDQISLEQLLYGLMLCSGNDAANVIAEMISGSQEEFAKLMNKEALALGATNSSFVNAHGLHSDQHYTTAYDLYLIFNAALQNETFVEIISSRYKEVTFHNRHGEAMTRLWSNSNRYLKGTETAPEGVKVIGGKTGTTYKAGNCLVLYSESSTGEPYISIVLKGDGASNLYYQMNQLLKNILN